MGCQNKFGWRRIIFFNFIEVWLIYNIVLISSVQQVLVAQLSLTLGDPMDYSPPGFSVRGISQARALE